MNISIIPVSYGDKEVLRNLLELYNYEFSQYDDTDVNNYGIYGYRYLDHYWTDDNRFAYFIKVDNKLAGFAMLRGYSNEEKQNNYSIAEFFVMYKYRKMGVGIYVMEYFFNKYKGEWKIGYTPRNKTAKIFWNKVVKKYSNGKYEIITNDINDKYKDGTIGETLIFKIE
jgi:predicted acetyltransferase